MNLTKIARKLVAEFKIEITEKFINESRKKFLSTLRKFDSAINSPQDAINLRDKADAFRQQMHDFFYEWLLHEHMKEVKYKGEDQTDALALKLQKSAWNLEIALTFYELEEFQANPYDDEKQLFQKKKDLVIARIQRLARTAFNDAFELATYSKYAGKEYTIMQPIDLNYAFLIPTLGTTKEGMRECAKAIEEGVQKIKQKGYGYILSPKIVVNVEGHSSRGSQAFYTPTKDDINVNETFGISADVFIHEMGHRLWFKYMNGNMRQYWKDAHDGDLFKLTEEDADEFMDLFEEINKDEDLYFQNFKTVYIAYLKKHNNNEIARLKIEQFMRHQPRFTKDSKQESFEAYRKFYKQQLVDKPFLKNYITDYGNTNELESFAEAFKLYCLGEPLPSMVESLLKTVTK